MQRPILKAHTHLVTQRLSWNYLHLWLQSRDGFNDAVKASLFPRIIIGMRLICEVSVVKFLENDEAEKGNSRKPS